MNYHNINRLREMSGGQSPELIAEYIGAYVMGDISIEQVERWTAIPGSDVVAVIERIRTERVASL